ncbi:tRNA (guanine-N(7)-)-methyltransferase-like isoform X2 [Aquila chrysaetos chrysaetos]|nr:tRNA (guanine-N(7)-)-methyltransferase-like isoform X2 [Aquila chrysaetos chrysaetos]
MGGGAGPVAGLRNRPAGSRGKTPRRTAGSVSDARSGSGAAPCRSCTERAGGSAGTAAAPAWGWAETEAASPRGQAAGRAASRGMPGAVVFADSAAGQQRGSRARRSPRCRRRGPRSPTGSDSGASPVSRGFPRASRCARSPTSRVDAPPCAVLQPGVRAPAPAPPAHAWSPGAAWRCAGRGSRRQRASAGTAEATLWVRLSVRPPGMPLKAAASGLRGLSLPGLPLLAARERRGTGGALTGCGQELVKLERPQKGKEEETEGRLAGSCLPLQARESLPLRVWKDPSS